MKRFSCSGIFSILQTIKIVVKVISSSLIIPKPNVIFFFYFDLLPHHDRTGIDKRLVGIDVIG